jgi:hypothetical protein
MNNNTFDMGTNVFKHLDNVPPGSARRACAITPSDDTDLTFMARRIYVGTSGHVTLVTEHGNTVQYKNVPAGTYLQVSTSRVKTATTAQDLVAEQ